MGLTAIIGILYGFIIFLFMIAICVISWLGAYIDFTHTT